MRKLKFINGGYYHVYNRGVDKRKIFLRVGYYLRFLKTIDLLMKNGTARTDLIAAKSLAFSQKLSFVCYCLMPNHYHFLLKQTADNGVTDFMHNLNTSYTKFFNISQRRNGRLFEYTFKAVEVVSDEQLLHLSRYIHLNPLVAGIIGNLEKYVWSSYLDFIGKRNGIFCHAQEILDFFQTSGKHNSYKKFVLDQADYAGNLEYIKKVRFD